MKSAIIAGTACLLACCPVSSQEEDFNSGNHWLSVCTADPETSPGLRLACQGYVAGMRDLNGLNMSLTKQGLWCLPGGVTVEQLRLIIVNLVRPIITFGFTSPFQNICRSIHAPNLNQVSMRFVLRTHDA